MEGQGKVSAGQEVSWKYLLFLREIALVIYQRHSTGLMFTHSLLK